MTILRVSVNDVQRTLDLKNGLGSEYFRDEKILFTAAHFTFAGKSIVLAHTAFVSASRLGEEEPMPIFENRRVDPGVQIEGNEGNDRITARHLKEGE